MAALVEEVQSWIFGYAIRVLWGEGGRYIWLLIFLQKGLKGDVQLPILSQVLTPRLLRHLVSASTWRFVSQGWTEGLCACVWSSF